ncbi:MAG: hypothetical protein FWF67_08485 [Fibromonadales bacterium]|nr:hypothetical protein [Fibromonadales bacterium]
MYSPRALLIILFLAILILFLVVFFVKKSKAIQDAQSYTILNPTCREFKLHSKKNNFVECFLNLESVSDLPANSQDDDTLYIPMAKFIGERFPGEFPLRIRHVFSLPDKLTDSIGISGTEINLVKSKNSAWRNKKNGCRFPGPCPVMPLKGSTIPQTYAKEDKKAERIFRNKFSSIGEAPVNAILPGKILKVERDSLFSVTVYHSENIYSKTSGLYRLNANTQIGNEVSQDSVLGFLPPKDTAFIFVEITRNGKYELWENFFKESRE